MDNVLISSDTLLSASAESLEHAADRGPVALHWYDLTCPFCYLGQARTRLLTEHGLTVVELPFQAHPDTPPEGTFLGQRQGSMYARIEQAAAEIGLPLCWPPRLPNSRIALAAAEWIRRHRHDAFPAVQARLFRAHFADGLDIGDLDTVVKCVAEIAGDADSLRQAFAGRDSFDWVGESERLAHRFGVAGTPAWRAAGQMIRGFISEAEFERVAALALATNNKTPEKS